MSDERHRDGLRHTRALERPNGRPAHVMDQCARTAEHCPAVTNHLIVGRRAMRRSLGREVVVLEALGTSLLALRSSRFKTRAVAQHD